MLGVLSSVPIETILLAVAITLVAGVVKGAVGFALPTIMVAGLSTFLSPSLAIASLLLPTIVVNALQAGRDGVFAAKESIRNHRLFLIVGGICLAASAQLITILSTRALLLIIGIPVVLFAILQLAGGTPRISPQMRRPAEFAAGSLAGIFGGLSGIWGPPTVLYLTALNTPKADAVRTLGVIFLLGSCLLIVAHVQSGLLTRETFPLSLLLIVPALVGMRAGQVIQDRLDQERFRRLTLIVLILAGANLIRRALVG